MNVYMKIQKMRRAALEAYIEQMIALLDVMDGDPDMEDGDDAEPEETDQDDDEQDSSRSEDDNAWGGNFMMGALVEGSSL